MVGTADRELRRFVNGLPKCELHVHLEGSLRPTTVAALAVRHGVDVGTPAQLAGRYEFRDFDHFIELFTLGLTVIRRGEDLVDATVALAAELAAQNVRYAEVTTTAYAHVVQGELATADYVAALGEGRRRARVDHGVQLGWIVDIPRGFEHPGAGFTADLLTGSDCPDGTVAIGLGGPEIGYPARDYAASFARVRAVGLGCVPHAGETAGAAYVRDALDHLTPDRIGHGVQCLDDPGVVADLRDRHIPLEVSITSNVLLGVVASAATHPLSQLRERGVVCSLNTDDPAFFSTTLTDELLLAASAQELTAENLRAVMVDAADASFLDASAKRRLRDEILAYRPGPAVSDQSSEST